MQKKDNNSKTSWVLKVIIITFILSFTMSYITTNRISNLNIGLAMLILIAVILIGIIFDIIGVSVTVADEAELHAKATKKLKGAKTSIKLIKNSAIVANICADVIGDVCGVLSGAISAMIAVKLTQNYELPVIIQYIISAIVASITVGGKAIGKNIANNKSTDIVYVSGKIISKFVKEDKQK